MAHSFQQFPRFPVLGIQLKGLLGGAAGFALATQVAEDLALAPPGAGVARRPAFQGLAQDLVQGRQPVSSVQAAGGGHFPQLQAEEAGDVHLGQGFLEDLPGGLGPAPVQVGVAHGRHPLGALVESPSLYGHLTGHEYVEITRLMRGGRPETARVLEVVGLTRGAHRVVQQYSLGMRLRLAMALAVRQPAPAGAGRAHQ